jgi:hypothetical protein
MTIERLRELREYHVTRIKRIDDAIELLQSLDAEASPPAPAVRRRRADALGTNGSKPIDAVRQALAGNGALTEEELFERSGLVKGQYGGRGSQEQRARRVLHMALARLRRQKEVKLTRDGYVASKHLAVGSDDGGQA